ncbi:transmembrane emp24 domain-containing protein 6-like [Limulus polyphemus]|uniref:Transmembrane emp24 domain-containing protein 6-like n=1 Tax=Limulus polyphemus TaxID=6850 RepID=A0ABM1BUP6_LIMPO|nr:transmembrane emp24 domain-containing protein 6-like [Limulus polyphemus]
MAFRSDHVLVVFNLLINIIYYCNSETYAFDNKLGISYEFKVSVEAGKEECFFQWIPAGATFYVAFQVMRGGDGNAGLSVRNPNGVFVLPYQWRFHAEYEDASVPDEGYYQLCIDNSLSRFVSKLVSLYVNSFIRDEWDKYVKELKSLDITVTNFTGTLMTVDKHIGEMLKYQDYSQKRMSQDWYLVDGNNRYVQYWSLAQCIVIAVASAIQVFFVRKLFDIKNVTPTAKPRA